MCVQYSSKQFFWTHSELPALLPVNTLTRHTSPRLTSSTKKTCPGKGVYTCSDMGGSLLTAMYRLVGGESLVKGMGDLLLGDFSRGDLDLHTHMHTIITGDKFS